MREAAFVFSLPSSPGGLYGLMRVEEAAVVNDTRPKVPLVVTGSFFPAYFFKKIRVFVRKTLWYMTSKYLEFTLHLSQV